VSVVSFVVILLAPALCRAQMIESVGIRAQGMGGAFVALADDATASWWNPAGLASSSLFSALVEGTASDATDRTTWGIALSVPSFALSYYRLPLSGIRPVSSTEPPVLGRQDPGSLSVFGATVGQSISDHLVIASTLKVLRGAGDTHGDLDIGVIGRAGHVRVGMTAKNLAEPGFGAAPDRISLGRQVRVGAAWTSDPAGPSLLALTMDADLTRTGTIDGDERHVAAGTEIWAPNRRLAIRGGVSANTIGAARVSGSAGMSLAIGRGAYVDGQLTRGADDARRGWSLGLRAAF
jgi:hypothetical protein